MDKRLYIVLGNGFSINLIDKLQMSDEIDLQNLFAKGDEVRWPGEIGGGFLSKKHCNNLWTLGARTTMTKTEGK